MTTTTQQDAQVEKLAEALRWVRDCQMDHAIPNLLDAAEEVIAAHRAALSTASVPPQTVDTGERYRHVKRGTVYEVIGEASLQIATGDLVDGSDLVIYRGEDGKLWAREKGEFHDGRFARAALSTASVPPQAVDTGEVQFRTIPDRGEIVAAIEQAARKSDDGWGETLEDRVNGTYMQGEWADQIFRSAATAAADAILALFSSSRAALEPKAKDV